MYYPAVWQMRVWMAAEASVFKHAKAHAVVPGTSSTIAETLPLRLDNWLASPNAK
jgi:hypothetical protein